MFLGVALQPKLAVASEEQPPSSITDESRDGSSCRVDVNVNPAHARITDFGPLDPSRYVALRIERAPPWAVKSLVLFVWASVLLGFSDFVIISVLHFQAASTYFFRNSGYAIANSIITAYSVLVSAVAAALVAESLFVAWRRRLRWTSRRREIVAWNLLEHACILSSSVLMLTQNVMYASGSCDWFSPLSATISYVRNAASLLGYVVALAGVHNFMPWNPRERPGLLERLTGYLPASRRKRYALQAEATAANAPSSPSSSPLEGRRAFPSNATTTNNATAADAAAVTAAAAAAVASALACPSGPSASPRDGGDGDQRDGGDGGGEVAVEGGGGGPRRSRRMEVVGVDLGGNGTTTTSSSSMLVLDLPIWYHAPKVVYWLIGTAQLTVLYVNHFITHTGEDWRSTIENARRQGTSCDEAIQLILDKEGMLVHCTYIDSQYQRMLISYVVTMLCICMLFVWTSVLVYRRMRREPYCKFRVARVAALLQVQLQGVLFLMQTVVLVVTTALQATSCTKFVLVWVFGAPSIEVVLPGVRAAYMYLYTPSNLPDFGEGVYDASRNDVSSKEGKEEGGGQHQHQQGEAGGGSADCEAAGGGSADCAAAAGGVEAAGSSTLQQRRRYQQWRQRKRRQQAAELAESLAQYDNELVAWTEGDIPDLADSYACSGGGPFCMETALKLAHFSSLVYDLRLPPLPTRSQALSLPRASEDTGVGGSGSISGITLGSEPLNGRVTDSGLSVSQPQGSATLLERPSTVLVTHVSCDGLVRYGSSVAQCRALCELRKDSRFAASGKEACERVREEEVSGERRQRQQSNGPGGAGCFASERPSMLQQPPSLPSTSELGACTSNDSAPAMQQQASSTALAPAASGGGSCLQARPHTRGADGVRVPALGKRLLSSALAWGKRGSGPARVHSGGSNASGATSTVCAAPTARTLLSGAVVPALELFDLREWELLHGEATDTRCLMAWGSNVVVIAFMGTATKANMLTDVKVALAQLQLEVLPQALRSSLGGRPAVHRGFLQGYRSGQLHRHLVSTVATLREDNPHLTVYCCGHSMGGALATLAAFDLALETGAEGLVCYTYGAPRTGNHSWRKYYDAMVPHTWRVINDADIVANRGKLFWLYKHAGRKVFLNRNGDLIANPNDLEMQVLRTPGASSVTDHMLTRYQAALGAVLRAQLGPKELPGGRSGVERLMHHASPATRDLLRDVYGLWGGEGVTRGDDTRGGSEGRK